MRKLGIRSATVAVAVAMAAAGCGSSSGSTDSGSDVGKGAAPTAAAVTTIPLPASLSGKAQLTVAMDASYAPNEFFATDNKTIIGMDADLANALGQVLGKPVTLVNAPFDSIIPGLAAGKYDLGMSSFTDTKEREQQLDFVTYFTAGTSLMVKKGNPEALTPDKLCGKKVAVEKGTTQADDDVPARSKTCTSAGQPAIQSLIFPDQGGANLALQSGRADGVLGDSPVIEYAVQQGGGQYETSGEAYATAPYGIAVPKNNGTAQAVQSALKQVISQGAYTKILQRWGVQQGALSTPVVNGATE